MRLSIIIPVYNGAATVPALVEALGRELSPLHDLEIVLVNDGSPGDDSAVVCAGLAAARPQVVFVDLAKNFGEHNAVMAGLNHCSGEAAVIIDDDFQNPPEEVEQLLCRLREGDLDVVYSRYPQKKHSWFRNLGSGFNDLVANFLLQKPDSLYLSSFKAMNRFLIDEIVRYRGPFPYIDGLILRTTDKIGVVTVRHADRAHGRSGYTMRKLVSLWLAMFTSFSVIPLRIASVTGIFFACAGMGGAVYFFLERLRHPDLPAGWASLILTLLVVSGVQLFALGMVGEYLGRLFLHAGGKPQYVVRRTVNWPGAKEP